MPKRKYNDIISQLDGTEIQKLKIVIPYTLPCGICKTPVINYRSQKNFIVCSYDCYSVMMLSKTNKMLHEE